MKPSELKHMVVTAAARQRTLAMGFFGDNPQVVQCRINCEGRAEALEAVAHAMGCKRMMSATDLQLLTR